jgi:dsRNA-specific ribonuclease
MEQKVVETIEKKIGYSFHKKALLEQAFTRKSFANEEGCPDNELLEFVGDEVLDFTITKMLLNLFTSQNDEGELLALVDEGGFTQLKQEYVDSEALSGFVDKLNIAQFLRMGKSDVLGHVENNQSVKEDLYEAIIGAIAIDSDYDQVAITNAVQIMDGNRANPAMMPMPIRGESLAALNRARNEYLDAREKNLDPNFVSILEAKMKYWARRVQDEIQKDYDEFETKLDLAGDEAEPLISLEQSEINYVSMLQNGTQLVNHSLPSYSIKAEKSPDGKKDIFHCSVSVNIGEGERLFESVADSLKLAKEEAAQRACSYVAPFVSLSRTKPDLKNVLSIHHAEPEGQTKSVVIGPGDCIGILNSLAQQRYFDYPVYSFALSEDRKTWTCTAKVESLSVEGKGSGSTKAVAKSAAAGDLFLSLTSLFENKN